MVPEVVTEEELTIFPLMTADSVSCAPSQPRCRTLFCKLCFLNTQGLILKLLKQLGRGFLACSCCRRIFKRTFASTQVITEKALNEIDAYLEKLELNQEVVQIQDTPFRLLQWGI